MNLHRQTVATAVADYTSSRTRGSAAESPKKPSSGQASMMFKWLFRGLLASMLAFLAVSILRHPLATNDGPVHVAFSHLMLTYHQPAQSLQSEAYTVQLKPSPNLGVYLLMATLMRVLSPTLTESIVQILCIFGLVGAGYFAINTINPGNVWLSTFLLPLALNQMFFLGLYNHCISMAAFFLVIGTYFWMSKSPSWWRALALSGTLLFTFLCHASGFVMAFTGLGALAATLATFHYSRGGRILPALAAQRYTILAMLVPLPLGAVFLASSGRNATLYGIKLSKRLWQFFKLDLLASNFPMRDRFAAFLISALLLLAFSIAAARILSKRRDIPRARRDQTIGVIVAALLSTLVMFVFPDVAGGGWTHFRRFELFPYFWIILVLAFEKFAPRLAVGLTALAAVVALVIISSLVVRQGMIRRQMEPLAQVDPLIGSHCTVLPVVLQPFLLDQYSNEDWMGYQPFFQSASRLELHDDRVVLFNYLARLPPYPVHFRPDIEPQGHIFLWEPQHLHTEVEQIDLAGFEAGSGMKVDYILLWGNLSKSLPNLQAQVRDAIAQFEPIYHSSDGNVLLYRRNGIHNPACTAAPQSSVTHAPVTQASVTLVSAMLSPAR